MKKLSILFFSIAASMLYFSCNKNNDLQNPDPVTIDSATIMGFKDSTQLIKSISAFSYDSANGELEDSATRYYFYDTLNKKIIISFQPVTNSNQSYDGVEYSYNNKGLVSHISWKYFATTPGDYSPFISSDYTYDDKNVIKNASVTLNGGEHYSVSFSKTVLPSGGYQLEWTPPALYNGYPDGTSFIVKFDTDGKMLAYYYVLENRIESGDSAVYDANGSISKLIDINFFYKGPSSVTPDSVSSYTKYDFVSRGTKGDQLYNLNQVVNNGLANIPNSMSYNFIGIDGIDDYVYQYSKYPLQNTKINKVVNYPEGGSGLHLINFNSTPEYDSKNRLRRYGMFFNDDVLSYVEYIISYYK